MEVSMPERVLPRDDFPKVPELLIPLSRAELQELGTFTAIWSQIDWIVLIMIAHFTKAEIGAVQFMLETATTGPRINMLKRLCQEDVTDAKIAVRKLCDDNSGLIEDRNHIIHGLWAIEWDYSTGTTTPACLYQKGKRSPIPAEKLKELSDRAATFSSRLGCLLEQINPIFAGEHPRRFFFGKGDPQGHAPPPWPSTQPQ
jgi:hypothetical protein